MRRVNIISWDNGAGMSKTQRIIVQTLTEAGFQITVQGIAPKPGLPQNTYFDRAKNFLYKRYLNVDQELQRLYNQILVTEPPYDINLFLEFIEPKWFPFARVNCLIPNQEWFTHWRLPYLKKFDWILCKTKYAQGIFEKLGCKTKFISFTSFDQLDKNQAKNYESLLHLAGRSLQKGTKTIIDLWLRHPEWPLLKIVQNRKNELTVAAENIKYITQYIDSALVREYQNYHGIHLCPSEAEGFGHYIVEAMSCQAVIITTNAPPMNELITPERGMLADYKATKGQGLGINYYVDPLALEQKIQEVLAMDLASKKRLGENARNWYEENNRFFSEKFVEVLTNI